ncbi:hypothetical protein F5X98DRAFT_288228 [Xylaria grammica]|nr:hypothetical protein F5X98DRAFT_288228 [Xylaria grammica]
MAIWIHRLSSIVGDGAPQLDLMATLFHYSRLMRAVPVFDPERLEGAFDMVEVEEVSTSLVETALDSVCLTQQPPGIRYLHHCGDRKVSPERLRDYLEEREGMSFTHSTLDQWLETARKDGLDRTLFRDSKQRIQFPVLIKSGEKLSEDEIPAGT